ncbi:MAG: hypothetical protein Q9168_001618 [Polycauliona sp. 1 TL-2023]
MSSIHQASSHAVPAHQQNPRSQLLPQVESAVAIERVVENLLQTLRSRAAVRFREAKFLHLNLQVNQIDGERRLVMDRELQHSSNIGDFRNIWCVFETGGSPDPQLPDLPPYFMMSNQWPGSWEQWSAPEFEADERDGLTISIDFGRAIRQMPLARADALLKASGQRGRYARVTLNQIVLDDPHPPLQWCFKNVVGVPGSEPKNFAVIVSSGHVVERQWC